MGHDGTTWACSPGYTVLPEEAKSLATLLASKSLDPITGPGFSVAGQRYAFTRGEVDDDEGGVVCFDLFLVVGLGGGARCGATRRSCSSSSCAARTRERWWGMLSESGGRMGWSAAAPRATLWWLAPPDRPADFFPGEWGGSPPRSISLWQSGGGVGLGQEGGRAGRARRQRVLPLGVGGGSGRGSVPAGQYRQWSPVLPPLVCFPSSWCGGHTPLENSL